MEMNNEEMLQSQSDPAEQEAAGTEQAAAEKAPFKVFATREEYQNYFDRILGQRLKSARKAEETLRQLQPVLQQLGQLQQPDGAADQKQSGGAAGSEPSVQTALSSDAILNPAGLEEAIKKDFSAVPERESALYEGADAGELAGDRRFLTLLSSGLSVTEAYTALHLNEIADRLARKTGKQVVDNIIARGLRPSENVLQSGISGNLSPNVAAMNNDEIDALLARAQRGENIML